MYLLIDKNAIDILFGDYLIDDVATIKIINLQKCPKYCFLIDKNA